MTPLARFLCLLLLQALLVASANAAPQKAEQLTAVLCYLQNCQIDGTDGKSAGAMAQVQYDEGQQLSQSDPSLFMDLKGQILQAGLLGGSNSYGSYGNPFIGAWYSTLDSIGLLRNSGTGQTIVNGVGKGVGNMPTDTVNGLLTAGEIVLNSFGGNLTYQVSTPFPYSNEVEAGVGSDAQGAATVALTFAGAAAATPGTTAVETATSEGTANAATYPGLTNQLANENLANIAAQDSRLAAAVNGSGTSNPNFSIGSGTATEADTLGQAWVGDGARLVSDQVACPGCLISADGTRIYRPPTIKQNTPTDLAPTGVQANFERFQDGVRISNGHLTITTP